MGGIFSHPCLDATNSPTDSYHVDKISYSVGLSFVDNSSLSLAIFAKKVPVKNRDKFVIRNYNVSIVKVGSSNAVK